jgi:pyruvyl transferase EpsI
MRIPLPLRWRLKLRSALASRLAPVGFPPTGPRIIIALAADYGNLGDVALTRSLLQFAATHLPSHAPYLLTAGRVFRDLRGVAFNASPDDVVVIVGGGNMGDIYPYLEEARLQVVRAFPNHSIISFPQSIDFSDTFGGRRSLLRSKVVYENHAKLEIFARDNESLRRMREAFPLANISAAPDTVLSMSVPIAGRRDLPMLVCLRQDKESAIDARHRQNIIEALVRHSPGAVVTDTVITGSYKGYADYECHLDSFLDQVARSQCMITDRLHGLIFSVITGTPCVVIENSNHKIRGAYESWLRDVPGIRLVSDSALETVMAAVEEVRGRTFVRPDLHAAFARLISALKK